MNEIVSVMYEPRHAMPTLIWKSPSLPLRRSLSLVGSCIAVVPPVDYCNTLVLVNFQQSMRADGAVHNRCCIRHYEITADSFFNYLGYFSATS